MFRGATKLTVDDKGRMVMPTRHRERLREIAEGRVVVTVDRDQCLLIYPQPEWEIIERRLMALPTLHSQSPFAAAGGAARVCCAQASGDVDRPGRSL
jgi:MraZ protein